MRKRLATEQKSTVFNTTTPASPKEALPVITFDQSLSVHFNGEDIRAIHFPHGHTDGDSVIFFSASNVVHLGDDFFAGRFPFVDLESGGSVEGLVKNIGELARRPNVTIKVGGLGMDIGKAIGAATGTATSEELAAKWRPYAEACVAAFTPQRAMFESNFPPDKTAGSYGATWNAFKRIAVSYSEDEQEYTRNLIPGPPPPGCFPCTSSLKSDEYTGRVGLQYFANEDVMLYGTVSKGYKAGGINLDPRLPDYEPETNQMAELGFKSTIAEGRLRLNGAIFYSDYEGIQLSALSC